MSQKLPRLNLVALAVVGLFLGTLVLNALPVESSRRGQAAAQERDPASPEADAEASPRTPAKKPAAETKPGEKKPSAKKPASKRPAKKGSDADDSGRAAIDPKVLEFVQPVAATDDDDPLLRKLKERHNLAAKLLETRAAEYRQNVGSLSLVLEAARTVVEAKLDLAPDQEARLTVLRQTLEVAEQIEKHYQTLSEEGLGAVSDLQRARLARVSVEVQILKLQREP